MKTNKNIKIHFSHSNETLGDKSPGSNFYIPVFSSFNTSHISAILWVFDTHSYGCLDNPGGYGCIEPI